MELSKRMNDELLTRDLVKVPTETLLKMSIANDARVKELTAKNVQIGQNPNIWDIGSNSDGYFDLNMDE